MECEYCGSWFCDGDCPEAEEFFEWTEKQIEKHVKNCDADGFCYICQCL